MTNIEDPDERAKAVELVSQKMLLDHFIKQYADAMYDKGVAIAKYNKTKDSNARHYYHITQDLCVMYWKQLQDHIKTKVFPGCPDPTQEADDSNE